eukprot:CAMPEP_0204609338 /NCGR_PEP_ID=MMETSP0661-20131031/60854_1 /ASSEMBLY_ACC=CAM_ASM_000606 /TAXON_ID=109239 /ORGANISM="Alexandrium margalefi, Strain AMGDE01CS-322" /LENGTH=281 /DNA_ID=CAMNT_0051620991 /DNA_START=85 /DNA_END=930 /DNA_ORIENTATION=+
MAMRHFEVVGVSGALCAFECPSHMDVARLMQLVEDGTGTPVDDQRLLVGTRELRELDEIMDDLPKDASTLTLVRRPPEHAAWIRQMREVAGRSPSAMRALAMPAEAWGVFDVALAAVSVNGSAFRWVADELRAHPQVLLAALTHLPKGFEIGEVFDHASDDLLADRDVVLAAVSQCGYALEYASDDLRADRDVVLAAVTQNGLALEHASDDLRADRDVVLAAVAQHGLALHYASGDLRGDRDVVLAAVAKHGCALRAASDNLRADRDVVLAAIAQDGDALK